MKQLKKSGGIILDKQLWNECVRFHGHECPGLAIGFRACEAVIEKMGIKTSEDEDIVCVTENDACGVDAVQWIFSCTVGKGNLIFHPTGKMAFSFYNRKDGSKLRVYLKRSDVEMTRDERQNYILTAPIDEVFEFSEPKYELPEKARIFNTIICEKCGEGAPEHKIRIQDKKMICLDCFEDYTRGF